jgi:hypothetical protein
MSGMMARTRSNREGLGVMSRSGKLSARIRCSMSREISFAVSAIGLIWSLGQTLRRVGAPSERRLT